MAEETRRGFLARSATPLVGRLARRGLLGLLAAEQEARLAAQSPQLLTDPTLIDPTIPDWSFFVKRTVQDTVVIYCVSTTLEQALADATLNLKIYAQDLTISGNINLPGRKVLIYAQRITVAPGARIDVTGPAAKGFLPGSRTDGIDAGSAGTAGTPGGVGSGGGEVTIFAESVSGTLTIAADGSAGGRGRDGGNGAQGRLGPQGGDSGCSPPGPGRPGGPGGRGGAAGAGGAGGNGGPGGAVRIHVIQPIAAGTFTASAKAGAAGGSGTNGTAGPGGLGGVGGLNHEFRRRGGGGGREGAGDIMVCVETGRAGNFGPGPAGPAAVSAPAASPGAAGTVSIAQATAAELAAAADVSQLLLLSHKTDIDYLNGAYSSVSGSLAWMQKLTSQTAPSPDVADQWTALNGTVTGQILQMKAGLDYYGLARNFVPLVNLSAFDQPILDMLDTAQRTQDAYTSYFQRGASSEQQVTALQLALHNANDSMTQLNHDLAKLNSDATDIQHDLAALATSLQTQQNALVVASADFAVLWRRGRPAASSACSSASRPW